MQSKVARCSRSQSIQLIQTNWIISDKKLKACRRNRLFVFISKTQCFGKNDTASGSDIMSSALMVLFTRQDVPSLMGSFWPIYLRGKCFCYKLQRRVFGMLALNKHPRNQNFTYHLFYLVKPYQDQLCCRLLLNADLFFCLNLTSQRVSASKNQHTSPKPHKNFPATKFVSRPPILLKYIWSITSEEWFDSHRIMCFEKKTTTRTWVQSERDACDRQSLKKLSDRGQLMSRYISFMNLHPPASSLPLVC